MRKMNGAFLTPAGRVLVNPPVAFRGGEPVLGGLKPLMSTNEICATLKVSKNQAQELRRLHPEQFVRGALTPIPIAA